MIQFSILGSGSGGNAALLRSGSGVILVDAGLSAAQLVARMERAGVRPDEIDGIILTHEHGDHSRGLAVLTKKYRIPVLANALTREVLRESVVTAGIWKTIPCGGSFSFAGFDIETFRVPHDAVEPMGFVLRSGGVALGVLSDLGHAPPPVRSKLQALDALFVEANYDEQMLANDTKRPWSTRQRIASRHGHLSNDQTAELLKDAASAALQQVVLGHLSRDCNSPDAACTRIREALDAAGCPHTALHCASQDDPTPWFAVVSKKPPVLAAPAAGVSWQQPELF